MNQLNTIEVNKRAKALGLMTQSEFRARLGMDIHGFNQWIASGKLPAPKFTLSNGERVWDESTVQATLLLAAVARHNG